MSENADLREAVTGLVTAAADLLKAMAEKRRQPCGQHVCWHYYQPVTTQAAAPVYPYTVTWTGGSNNIIGTG